MPRTLPARLFAAFIAARTAPCEAAHEAADEAADEAAGSAARTALGNAPRNAAFAVACTAALLMSGARFAHGAPATPQVRQMPDTRLALRDFPVTTSQRVVYRCDAGHSLEVTYLNTPRQSLALMRIDGTPWLLVDTPAASGVRYQAGRYIWWTKGRTGQLRVQRGPADALLRSCDEARQ